jgi:signal transduction histidine kinase
MGWSIITVQPGAKELLLPVREARQLTLVALTFASLLAIAATAWLSLRLARPVEAFAHHLGELARQGGEFRAEAPFAAPAIAEYAQMVESAGRLHASLSASIAKLAARTHELQLANQETTARAEQLERLDKLRTEFLDALSHDLRIPLTAIQGYVELLEDLDDPALGTAGRQYVEHIDEGRKRMQVMVEDLLDQARLGVGRLVLHRERVDLAALLQQTGAFFEPLARDKDLHFEVACEHPGPRPEADANRLVQILNNLISNAIKYTPAGGRVEVSARAVGPDAEIAVADTGVGLDPEDKAHLFEKFYRSKRPEVQREHGSGLGLALAKGLVEAHGGRLEVDSTLGEGTVFRCYLPLAPVTAGGVPG